MIQNDAEFWDTVHELDACIDADVMDDRVIELADAIEEYETSRGVDNISDEPQMGYLSRGTRG